MTTLPPGEGPDDDQPPNVPAPPPPDAYGPYPYPYPPQYPQGLPPPRPTSRIATGMAMLGAFLYFVINFVIAFMAIAAADSGKGVLIGAAVLLAVIAFGGGGALLATRNPTSKGLGLGLMIGWALTSLFTAGFCTGINPTMYS